MIDGFRVIWKTIKDIWEDMLILVLMNVLTLICAIPLIAAIGIPTYVAFAGGATPVPILPALLVSLVLSIPAALPFGGALFALYAVCNRVASGFAIAWEHYFTNFKQSFFTAWRYVILANAISILILVNFLWYPQAFPDQSWVFWVMGAWLAASVFWLAVQFYVFPFYIEQENKSWRIAVKNAALIAGANPLFTLLLLVVSLTVIGLSILFLPPLFVLLGLLIWTMAGTEAVGNRIAMYRLRVEAEKNKKQAKQG